MPRGKTITKTIGIYALPCCITAGVLLLVYLVFGLFPFTSKIVAWGDMLQQSIPLLLDFKQILNGNFDFFLNTANGGGMSFFGVFFFFLASPFSLLSAFIPIEEMHRFGNLLILFKLCMASFTAMVLFRRRFRHLLLVQQATLAVLYSFCGFAMLFYQNLIWLDVLWLFPLLALGFYALLTKGKLVWYVLTLSAMVAMHYYMSFMVVVFLLLAIGVWLLFGAKKGTRKKTASLFALGSLLSALLTAVFWLPSLLQYGTSARGVSFVQSVGRSDFFALLHTTLPIVLCTGCVVAVIPMFFLAKLYRKRENRVLFVLLLLTLIPLVVEPINKVWHTGSYQCFPARYGYIPVLLGLCITASFLQQQNRMFCLAPTIANKPRHSSPYGMAIFAFLWGALLTIAILLLTLKRNTLRYYISHLWLNWESFFCFLLFAGLCALLFFGLFLLLQYKLFTTKVGAVCFLALTVLEVFFSSAMFLGLSARSTWNFDNALSLSQKVDSSDLFRTKLYKKYFDVNLVGGMGYNSLAHYTSLTDEDFLYTMKKLGYSAYWMEVGGNGGTLVSDLLLANRYTIIKNTEWTESDWDFLSKGLLYSLLVEPSVDSFGVVAQGSDLEHLATLPHDRRTLQKQLAEAFYGAGDAVTLYTPTTLHNVILSSSKGKAVLQRAKLEDCTITYKIPVAGEETLYFDCFDKTTNALKERLNDAFTVLVNGKQIAANYPSQSLNGFLHLGTFQDETVTVTLELQENVIASSFGVFGVDESLLKAASAAKPNTTLVREGNTMTGTVEAKEGEVLFLPLQYQKGYTITVNGQQVTPIPMLQGFFAIPLQAGENTLTLRYVPQGFVPGLVISLCAIPLVVLSVVALKKGWLHRLSFVSKPLFWLVLLLSFATFFAVYLLPLGLWLTNQ